jgi:hypothetical protein
MVKKQNVALAMAIVGAISVSAMGAPVTPGDLVVYRVGTGTGSLVNTGNSVFLDEYTPAGVLVQSIAAPTADSGSTHSLIASGTATSEGALAISPNGQFVTFTGYDATTGGSTSLTGSSSTTVPRTVGILNVATGAIDTSTALTDFSTGNNPRTAVTTDGTNLWVGGAAGGVRYTNTGSTTSTQLSTTVTNIRQVNIFGGQLYSSDSSGSTVRLGTDGSNLPTTSGQTITNLPGFPVSGSPYSFFFADLSPSVAGLDTLYVADDTPGTILKYSLVGGSWTANGSISAAGVRGLTGIVSGGTVDLYADTGGSGAAGGGTIWSLADASGYDNAITGTLNTLVASSPADEAFRGIAVVPSVPEPTVAGLLGLASVLTLGRRRRK